MLIVSRIGAEVPTRTKGSVSLTAGSIVAITNSVAWAAAVCYMSHQKAQVAMWQATRSPVEGGGGRASDAPEAAPTTLNHRSAVPLP